MVAGNMVTILKVSMANNLVLLGMRSESLWIGYDLTDESMPAVWRRY